LPTEVEPPQPIAHTDVVADAGSRTLQISCRIALIGIAVARAWLTRYELNPDGMSYLDMARGVASGHPAAVVNAYWSPGYPLLISTFFWVFRPGIHWEFPLVHLVNVLIFIGALACFQMFWNQAAQWNRKHAGAADYQVPEYAFWMVGYAVFGIATLNQITVGLVGPDLLVSAFCLLAGWGVLYFRNSPGVGRSLLLGLVLGLGYYAKAPFLPVGIIFLACACLRWPVSPRAALLAGTMAVAFALVCAPLVAALSLAKGRLTFGDSARMSEAFYINGVQAYRHWQGGPPGAGMPVHPTRKLNDFPEIYEFAANDMGTYPPWFDPTYWYAGIKPHVEVKRQMAVFIRNLALEFQFILESAAELVCILVFLAMLSSHRKRWVEGVSQLWFIWMPGAMALTMFALIHVEPRFLGGWLILLFAGGLCACSLPADAGTSRAVSCVGFATLITAGAVLLLGTSREAVGIDHEAGRNSQDASIAVSLLSSGLHPGDRVALIGNGTGAYWAHLAQLRIVAEIPTGGASRAGRPALDFWESGPESQQKSLAILRQTGARVVISGPQSDTDVGLPAIVPSPWRKIARTGAYVYFFPADR
jgi:hypothetical protein